MLVVVGQTCVALGTHASSNPTSTDILGTRPHSFDSPGTGKAQTQVMHLVDLVRGNWLKPVDSLFPGPRPDSLFCCSLPLLPPVLQWKKIIEKLKIKKLINLKKKKKERKKRACTTYFYPSR
ncbi:hypothetical protein I7I48_03726 [Histoplasma ohiense]|nr:hypothetical protein I7I48_03726 [Histoplasma ohiense (nom. inval.)]